MTCSTGGTWIHFYPSIQISSIFPHPLAGVRPHMTCGGIGNLDSAAGKQNYLNLRPPESADNRNFFHNPLAWGEEKIKITDTPVTMGQRQCQ